MPGTTASTPKKLAPAKEVAAPTGRATREKATAGAKDTHSSTAGDSGGKAQASRAAAKPQAVAKTHAADKAHAAAEKAHATADKAHDGAKAHPPAKAHTAEKAAVADKAHASKAHATVKGQAAEKPQVAEKAHASDKAHLAEKAHAGGAKAHTDEKAHADGHATAGKAHAGDKVATKAAPRHEPTHRKAAEGYAGDHKFLESQRKALVAERDTYLEQAESLRAEADSLVEEMEPGDIQFDEESGEGGTVTVDRERDLALSAQALVAVEEIDHALAKIDLGTYGICEGCGTLIPKNRLEALPYARLCIACKSGGLSRR